MLFTEVLAQLTKANLADPAYRLFETNCRWFARRCVLSVAQRLSSAGATTDIQWEGFPSNLESLITELHGDWFGGRQMAGPRGKEIRASALLSYVPRAWYLGDFLTAEKHSREALNILQSISAPTEGQVVLLSESLHNLGRECRRRGELDRALELLEVSRSIFPPGKRMANVEEEYARALFDAGRVDEAIAIQEGYIPYLRSNCHYPLAYRVLHDSLVPHAVALARRDNRLNEALSTIQEALQIIRQLSEQFPEYFESHLARDLSLYGYILQKLGQLSEAHEAIVYSISLTRHVLERQPNSESFDDLIHRLLGFAGIAKVMGRQEEVLNAMGYVYELWKPLCDSNPDSHLAKLTYHILQWAITLHDFGFLDEALGKLVLGLKYERRIPDSLPTESLIDRDQRMAMFAHLLHKVACQLLEKSDSRAAEVYEEAVMCMRDVASRRHSEEVRERLADFLFNHATIMMKMKLRSSPLPANPLEKGRDLLQEAVRCYKSLKIVDSDVLVSTKLGDALLLLSVYERLLGRCIFALDALSLAFRIIGPRLDLDVLESVESMESLMGEWALNIKHLYSNNLNSDGGLPYALEFVARLRDLTASYPVLFLEKDLAMSLKDLAVWISIKFQRQKEAETLLQESLQIHRRLFAAGDASQRKTSGTDLVEVLIHLLQLMISEPSIIEPAGLGRVIAIIKELKGVESSVGIFGDQTVLYDTVLELSNLLMSYAETHSSSGTLPTHTVFSTHDGVESNPVSTASVETGNESLHNTDGVDHDVPISRFLELGNTLNQLTQDNMADMKVVPSLRSASLAFQVFHSLLDPHVPETIEDLQKALGLWSRCVESLYDTSAEEGVLYADEYIAQQRGLCKAFPDIFFEEQLCESLRETGIWMFQKLHLRTEANSRLRDSIQIGLELGRKRDSTMWEQCSIILLNTLLSYLSFFTADSVYPISLTEALKALISEERVQKTRELENGPRIEVECFLASVLDTAARDYDDARRFNEALKISEHSISLRREVYGVSASYAIDLSNSLQYHAHRLIQMESQQEQESSWEFIEQAVELEREVYSSDPLRHRQRLAKVLLQYAGFAQRLLRCDVALVASIEAINLTWSAFREDEETNLNLLAHRLVEHAKFVERMGAREEAFKAVEEALPLWRRLDCGDPQKYRQYLVELLHYRFELAWDLDRVSDALTSMKEKLQMMKFLILREPGRYENIFENNFTALRALWETSGNDFPQYEDIASLADFSCL